MPRFEKDGHVIETAVSREAAQLRAEGYRETKARTVAVKAAESDTSKTSK